MISFCDCVHVLKAKQTQETKNRNNRDMLEMHVRFISGLRWIWVSSVLDESMNVNTCSKSTQKTTIVRPQVVFVTLKECTCFSCSCAVSSSWAMDKRKSQTSLSSGSCLMHLEHTDILTAPNKPNQALWWNSNPFWSSVGRQILPASATAFHSLSTWTASASVKETNANPCARCQHRVVVKEWWMRKPNYRWLWKLHSSQSWSTHAHSNHSIKIKIHETWKYIMYPSSDVWAVSKIRQTCKSYHVCNY